jgi:hypothetical protein
VDLLDVRAGHNNLRRFEDSGCLQNDSINTRRETE